MVEHKAGDVVKMLRELHYEEIRISGDHHMFRGPKGNLIPVAYSSRKTLIPVGTYKHILHQRWYLQTYSTPGRRTSLANSKRRQELS